MTVQLGKWEGVVLNTISPLYKGTITRKELEYSDWTRAPIPVSDVPLGEKVGILIGGTNNMATTQQMGISWEAKDPDGIVVDSYDAWEMWPYTSAGAEHQFAEIAGQFYLDKVGTYTIKVELLMNRDSPVVVDSYSGVLGTTTTEVPPEFVLIHHTIYHLAYICNGEVERIIATFKTDPFTPAAWSGDRFASKLEEEYRAKGGNPLEVKVYVDKTPLLWTNFRVELIGTPLGEAVAATSGMAIAGIPVAISIILIALAIIGVLVTFYLVVKSIVELFKSYPGLKDMKPGWDKEALILDIQGSEKYFERPPTPVATLEAMSEVELRDYLDQIAEQEVPPPGISWGWIAVGAGALGVLLLASKAKPGKAKKA